MASVESPVSSIVGLCDLHSNDLSMCSLHASQASTEPSSIGLRRDLTPTSTTTTGGHSPPLHPRPHQSRARSSFTIADLLGANDAPSSQDIATSISPSISSSGSHDAAGLAHLDSSHVFDDPDAGDSAPQTPHDDHASPRDSADPGSRFEWLQCTRYHPPKLPRESTALSVVMAWLMSSVLCSLCCLSLHGD